MRYSSRGVIGTIVFHLIILMIFIYFGFATPLPLPAEQGILINFGNVDEGSSNTETFARELSAPVQASNKAETQETYLTQEVEDAPSLNIKKESVVKKNNNSEKKETPVKETRVEEKKVEEVRKVDVRALYRGNTNSTSTSDGTSNKQGNQGSESGEPDVPNYHAGLSQGNGGISFSLTGRNPQYLASPKFNRQEEGVVVVEITVDREGNVTNAIPGVKGSTTLNSYLLNEAKQAALNSKFNREPNSPAYQKGTVTYRFILK